MNGYLSQDQLDGARASVPIVCVDLVPIRRTGERAQVGLIRRAMPERDEPVWCHLGGRVRRGETLRAALLRHVHETLTGTDVQLPADPQPDHVMQYFPDAGPVEPGLDAGFDPRQHSVALVYGVSLVGEPAVVPGGEAQRFRWWTPEDLGERDDLWPGCLRTVHRALRS